MRTFEAAFERRGYRARPEQSILPKPPTLARPNKPVESRRDDAANAGVAAVASAIASATIKPAPPDRVAAAGMSPALHAALDLFDRPHLVRVMRRSPLPDDTSVLVRIAGGCRQSLARAAAESRRDPETISEAVRIYVRHILWSEDDNHRIMGVPRGAPRREVAVNLLWFTRWIATDWGSGELEDAFARKVLRAWDALKAPEKRRGRRRGRGTGSTDEVLAGVGLPPLGQPLRRAPKVRSSRRLQVLATIAAVLGVIAIVAIDWAIMNPPSGKAVPSASLTQAQPGDG